MRGSRLALRFGHRSFQWKRLAAWWSVRARSSRWNLWKHRGQHQLLRISRDLRSGEIALSSRELHGNVILAPLARASARPRNDERAADSCAAECMCARDCMRKAEAEAEWLQ